MRQQATLTALCAGILLLAIIQPTTAQQLNLRAFGQDDGLPQMQVRTVCQDDKGFIWFGTFAGAARYDGSNMEVFTVEDGLPSNSVLRILKISQGRLLILTTFGVVIYDGESFSDPLADFSDIIDGRFFDAAILEDETFIANENGLFRLSDETLSRLLPADTSHGPVTAVAPVDGSELWAAAGKHVYHVKRNTEEQYLLDSSFPYTINTIMPLGQDAAYVGTSAGMFEIRNGNVSQVILAGLHQFVEVYSIVHSFMPGGYLLATRLGVVHLVDGEVLTYNSTSNGLPSPVIYTAYIDNNSNVWLGTGNGAAVIFPAKFVHFGVNDGLKDPEIQSIFETSRGHLLVGSSDNALAVYKGGTFESFSFGQAFNGNSINDIDEDPAGNIILTTGRGLYRLNEDLTVALLDAANPCVVTLVDSQNRIWVGSIGALYRYENGQLREAFPGQVKGAITVMSICEDSAGNIWFATRNRGVLQYDGKQLNVFDSLNGFTNVDVWSVAPGLNGDLWLATGGEGVYRYRKGHFSQFTTADGLSNDTVWLVLPDSKGYVWCGTNAGIDRFDGSQFTLYTTDDGLAENESMNDCCYEDSNGHRWFGSASGLSLALDVPYEFKYVEPPIYLKRFEVNGQPFPITENRQQLNSDQRFVLVEAIVPSYRAEGSLKYLSQLEGLEDTWTEHDHLRPFRYTNLTPGAYTFRLRTSYKDKVSTNEATLSFVISPPFYQTPWFTLLVITILPLMVYAWHKFREGRMNYINQRLEQKVKDRTTELQSANRELQAFNVAVTNNLKVPVRHIIGFSEIAASPKHADNREHYLNRIHRNARNLNNMIGDLHDLAMAGSIEVEQHRINLSLEARMAANKLRLDNPEYTAELVIEEDFFARCDERLMGLVLTNLISNAFKATMHMQSGRVTFSCEERADESVYFISDNGIGLSEEQQEQLFQPFTTIHHPDVFPGKGLGLIIVQRAIQRQKGRVWVESNPDGQGITVLFTIE